MSKTIVEPSDAASRALADATRRNQDGAHQLSDGFHLKARGRDGMIYFRDGNRMLELYIELNGSAPGLLVYTAGLDTWVLPSATPVRPADKVRVRSALEVWAGAHNFPITFVSPEDLIRPWEDIDANDT